MFRRKRRVKSTPNIDTSKNTNSTNTKSKRKESQKLNIFKKKKRNKEKLVTIKINSNSHSNINDNQSPAPYTTQSYTKLKLPSTNIYKNTYSNDNYIITAFLRNDILTITVYHGIKTLKWRQQFTQNSFKNISIYDVSKVLIRSIQETANKNNKKRYKKWKNNYDNIITKNIKIFEYNCLCYVTLIDSHLPSFALRPWHDTKTSDLNGINNKKHQRYSTPNISNSNSNANYNKKPKLYPNNPMLMQDDEYSDYVNYYNGNITNINKNIRKWSDNANFNRTMNINVNDNHMNNIYRKVSMNDTLNSGSYNTYNTQLSSPISNDINSNYSRFGMSDDTNTTITMDAMDNDENKGPGFNHNQYKHKINKNKDNIKYGFV